MAAVSEPSAAPGVRASGYEIANALGRLNADRPKLGERCMEAVPVAQAIRYFLHALDLYAQATGRSPEQVARDVRRGRIEVRYDGGRIVVVTP